MTQTSRQIRKQLLLTQFAFVGALGWNVFSGTHEVGKGYGHYFSFEKADMDWLDCGDRQWLKIHVVGCCMFSENLLEIILWRRQLLMNVGFDEGYEGKSKG